MMDHFGDDEVEPLLRKRRVEVCSFGQRTKSLDLSTLAVRIGSGQAMRRFQTPHLLGELESLGKQMHERRVDVVDALTNTGQLFEGSFGLAGGGVVLCSHNPTIMQRSCGAESDAG